MEDEGDTIEGQATLKRRLTASGAEAAQQEARRASAQARTASGLEVAQGQGITARREALVLLQRSDEDFVELERRAADAAESAAMAAQTAWAPQVVPAANATAAPAPQMAWAPPAGSAAATAAEIERRMEVEEKIAADAAAENL